MYTVEKWNSSMTFDYYAELRNKDRKNRKRNLDWHGQGYQNLVVCSGPGAQVKTRGMLVHTIPGKVLSHSSSLVCRLKVWKINESFSKAVLSSTFK